MARLVDLPLETADSRFNWFSISDYDFDFDSEFGGAWG